MEILITGGAGFIGSNLVATINSDHPEWKIRVIDDLSSGLLSNIENCEVEFIEESILNLQALENVAKGVSSIVHLAAIGSVPRSVGAPRPTHEANATGTLNVLEAAKTNHIRHVVVASSSSVYGSNPNIPRSEYDWTRPLSPYAVSKLATEAYAGAYSHSYGMKTLAFRFFNVYGPGQRPDHPYAAVIPRFISAALRGDPLQIFGDGEQTRDFTYVDSVCHAIQAACSAQIHSAHPVNLAFGSKSTVNELVKVLEKDFGRKLPRDYLPTRAGDVRDSQADPTLLDQLIPDVNATELSDGIRRTVQWISENY